MDMKELLRSQAIARALGEIEAALMTFTTDDAKNGFPHLYRALKDANDHIRGNW